MIVLIDDIDQDTSRALQLSTLTRMIDGRDVERESLDLFIIESNLRSNHSALFVNPKILTSFHSIRHASIVTQIQIIGKDLQESRIDEIVLLDVDMINILIERRPLIVDVRDVDRQSILRCQTRLARIRENQSQHVSISLFTIQRLSGQENERRVSVRTVDVERREVRRSDVQLEFRRRVEIRGDQIGDDHFLLFHFRFVDGDLQIERVRVIDDLDGLQREIPGQQRGTIVDIVHVDDHVGEEGNLISIFALNDQFPRLDRFVVQRTDQRQMSRRRIQREIIEVLLAVRRREKIVRRWTRRERFQL